MEGYDYMGMRTIEQAFQRNIKQNNKHLKASYKYLTKCFAIALDNKGGTALPI